MVPKVCSHAIIKRSCSLALTKAEDKKTKRGVGGDRRWYVLPFFGEVLMEIILHVPQVPGLLRGGGGGLHCNGNKIERQTVMLPALLLMRETRIGVLCPCHDPTTRSHTLL